MFNNLVFLTHTDTTIGFVSQNKDKLDDIKRRPRDKKYIKAVNSLSTLKKSTRVPTKYKNRVRRANKTTFIINQNSYRVIKDKTHLVLLNRLKWAYTTSANLSGDKYNEAFAKAKADVIISSFKQNSVASSIYKIGRDKIQKIR